MVTVLMTAETRVWLRTEAAARGPRRHIFLFFMTKRTGPVGLPKLIMAQTTVFVIAPSSLAHAVPLSILGH